MVVGAGSVVVVLVDVELVDVELVDVEVVGEYVEVAGAGEVAVVLVGVVDDRVEDADGSRSVLVHDAVTIPNAVVAISPRKRSRRPIGNASGAS